MSGRKRGRFFAALNAAGLASVVGFALVLGAGPALADPDDPAPDPGAVAAPGGPPPPPPADPLAPPQPPLLPFPGAQAVAAGPAAGQNPSPFTGTAPFGPPS